jgi:AcrR family transcriptional regulator
VTARATPRRPASGGQERAERTRAAVVEEAVRCIIDEGFTAPSARRITERAGVTWGAVQYHFGDLDGLLMAVVDQGLRELTDALDGLTALPANASIAQRTAAVVDAVWEAFSSPTSRAALEILIVTRAGRDAATNQHLADVLARLTALGKRLGEGLAAPDAAEIGNLIWATLRGIVVAQMVSPTPLDSSRDRRTLVAVITAYITAHTPTAPSRRPRARPRPARR